MEQKDFESLERSVNDDSSKASAIWITFITLELYLLMAFGSITYRDLLLETPLKLPLLGTELPLLGFAEIAPSLLVIFHFYILLQLAIFGQKVRSYEKALEDTFPFASDRELARQRLSFFFKLQSAAGTKLERSGVIGFSLKVIGWLTLIAIPILILLQALLTFLPYHNGQSVWTIRALIAIDLVLVVCLGAFRGTIQTSTRLQILTRLLQGSLSAVFFLMILAFSTTIAVYPGEHFTEQLPFQTSIEELRKFLFSGPVDEVTGLPRSHLSNRIVLTDQVFTSDQEGKRSTIKSFRGRDLREAVLIRSDLRGADFTGAMLSDAIFNGAQLDNAKFGCSDTGVSDGQSWLEEKRKLAWPDDGCTWLERTRFSDAKLRKASFFFSHLEDSDFSNADLSNSEFAFAKLNGSNFYATNLLGAALQKSEARGSSFFDARLQAANLFETDFTGASFVYAHLEGAGLNRANFDGCTFKGASLQGATITDVSFRGAFLVETLTWRATWESYGPPTIEETSFNGMNGDITPWDNETDAKRKTFSSWRAALLNPVPVESRSDISDQLSGLDPKQKAPATSLKGELSKQEPNFQIGNQIAFLVNLICSDDADYYIASGIVKIVKDPLYDSLIPDRVRLDFSNRLHDGFKEKKCHALDDADDDFWKLLDGPTADAASADAIPRPDVTGNGSRSSSKHTRRSRNR
jgi:uncharacterized protein YjbI with pentapeptide repeats